MENQFEQNLFNNLMDTWVLPSIQERQKEGSLEKPLSLGMAQILFKSDGSKPEVRVNSEVKGRAIFKISKEIDKPPQVGEPVYLRQLDEMETFELAEDDRDCGHATLIKFPDKWLISFDFIYNKKSSQEHLSAAKEFLYAAKSSLKKNYLRASIDSLHSASELAAKAYLLGRPDKSIVEARSHNIISTKINTERKLGNVNETHIGTFNKLKNLRASARYLHTELTADYQQVENMVNDITGFIDDVSKLSESKL